MPTKRQVTIKRKKQQKHDPFSTYSGYGTKYNNLCIFFYVYIVYGKDNWDKIFK